MVVRFARFTGEKVSAKTPEEGLCVSSFLIAKDGESVLLGKAFLPEGARGKWVIPSSHLLYGEHPDDAARRILGEQLKTEAERIFHRGVWSYVGNHWDLCFIYEVVLKGEPKPSSEEEVERFPEGYFASSQLLTELRYLQPPEIRIDQLGRGHDYVLQALGILKPAK